MLFRGMRTFGVLAALVVTVLGCESSAEPLPSLSDITRVSVTFTPPGGGSVLTAYIDDPDGVGPQAPTAQVGSLVFQPGTTYTGSVTLENRLTDPVTDVTTQVLARASDYRLYHRVAGLLTGAGFIVTPTDGDAQGRPVGLAFTAAVNAESGGDTGALELTLCDYASGGKLANATTCGGAITLRVTFAMSATN